MIAGLFKLSPFHCFYAGYFSLKTIYLSELLPKLVNRHTLHASRVTFIDTIFNYHEYVISMQVVLIKKFIDKSDADEVMFTKG